MTRKHYEPADPPIRPVVSLGVLFAGIVVAMSAIAAALVLLFNALDDRPPASAVPLSVQWQQQPSPTLTIEQGFELARLRARANARLSTYGWVDRNAAIVHIPIERAMTLVISELPVRNPPSGEGESH